MFQAVLLAIVSAISMQNFSPDSRGLQWKVGDKADYNMDMGFIKGSMNMIVREENAKGFWVNQDADLGFAGKQKIEVLYDKNTGAPLEMIVNGEKQNIPDPADIEVVETRNEKVTVPAGNFDVMYVKMKDTKSKRITEGWINPQVIPISGMAKTVTETDFGKVNLVLKSFKKN